MQVITDNLNTVWIDEDSPLSNDRRTPCQWACACSNRCEICPANGELEVMGRLESIGWWLQREDIKENK